MSHERGGTNHEGFPNHIFYRSSEYRPRLVIFMHLKILNQDFGSLIDFNQSNLIDLIMLDQTESLITVHNLTN